MKKIFSFYKNDKFRFVSLSILYLLWTIWLGNYWFLLGEIIIFDLFITKKVWWTFWKKKNVEKQPKLLEWADAIIVAGFAALMIRTFILEAYTIPTSSMEKSLLVGDYLFVSKINYGPRVPETPLSFPFVHHTLPLTKNTPSYVTWIKNSYHRLAGLRNVERNDIVVFNFPAGDTVCANFQAVSYYELCRQYGRKAVWDNQYVNPQTGQKVFGKILVRPVDKEENYVKRCVAIAGDTIKLVDGQLYVNGKKAVNPEKLQNKYYIKTNGTPLNPRILKNMDITEYGRLAMNEYFVHTTPENIEKMRQFSSIEQIVKDVQPAGQWNPQTFPHDSAYKWNEDNFGPLYIPKKGATIALSLKNLPLYRRAITSYEHNTLKVKNGTIFINGSPATHYTFKQDYYWMQGDNRKNSADSRFWGFVPEDHIVGEPVFIWMSMDKEGNLFNKIRWSRLFKIIH